VIRIDTCGAGSGFLDPPAEGIVLEAYGVAAAGQGDAGETILEVPGEGGGAGRGDLSQCVAVGVVGIDGARRGSPFDVFTPYGDTPRELSRLPTGS
jgi:hypothetical protein